MNKEHNLDDHLERCRELYILGCGLNEKELISATKFGEAYLNECIRIYSERNNLPEKDADKILKIFKEKEKEFRKK